MPRSTSAYTWCTTARIASRATSTTVRRVISFLPTVRRAACSTRRGGFTVRSVRLQADPAGPAKAGHYVPTSALSRPQLTALQTEHAVAGGGEPRVVRGDYRRQAMLGVHLTKEAVQRFGCRFIEVAGG